MSVLQVKGLTKSFGANKVIDNISFDVPKGEIFGFLGANGAGKTTTMKMILGLLAPDSGEIYVAGEKVSFGETKTNRHLGYLPDVPQFYGYMRPKEYLKLCGEIAGLTFTENNKRCNELLEIVGLSGTKKKIAGFSRGMKQRLGMAQALINEPQLLICDEPTSALDPVGRKEILDTLEQIMAKTTVIFSTHILSDVERIATRIAILSGGHIALSGTLAELKSARRSNSLYLEFASLSDKERFTKVCQAEAPALIQNMISENATLTLRVANRDTSERKVLRTLGQEDILPIKLEVLEPTIESLYLEVAK